MAVRLTSFRSQSDNGNVQSVIDVLNKSYVQDTTALGLLEALAERLGPTVPFKVHCSGDYTTNFVSVEYLANAARKGWFADKELVDWLTRILGPAPHKIVYNDCYGGFSLSEEAEIWLREHGVSEEEINDFTWSNRHHPTLVRCVETLGRRASGECSKLAIAEIDSDRYRITEYDGWETVEVPEDLAWIVI